MAVVRNGDDGWVEAQGGDLSGVGASCGDEGEGMELRKVRVKQDVYVRSDGRWVVGEGVREVFLRLLAWGMGDKTSVYKRMMARGVGNKLQRGEN